MIWRILNPSKIYYADILYGTGCDKVILAGSA